MTGKSPLLATKEQQAELMALASSRDRGEADRARAVLLTLTAWTASQLPSFSNETEGLGEGSVLRE